MADLDVFTKVFERIDTVVSTLILSKTANLIAIVSPLLLAGFIVYVIFVTWSYVGSSLEQSMFDLLKRIAAWAVIISFSINVAAYNSNVVPLVLNLGDTISNAFSGGSANASALDSLVKLLFDMMAENNKVADQSTGIDGISDSLSAFFINMVIAIIFSLFLVIAAAYILLAKVFLAILAVLGPIFIALAMFPATRQFFSAWLNQVVSFTLYLVLINIVGSILIQYLDTTFDNTALLSDSGVLHLIIVIILFAIILLKLPELASGLGGGISNNGFGALAQTASSVTRLMGGAKGGKNPPSNTGAATGGSIKAEGKGK